MDTLDEHAVRTLLHEAARTPSPRPPSTWTRPAAAAAAGSGPAALPSPSSRWSRWLPR